MSSSPSRAKFASVEFNLSTVSRGFIWSFLPPFEMPYTKSCGMIVHWNSQVFGGVRTNRPAWLLSGGHGEVRPQAACVRWSRADMPGRRWRPWRWLVSGDLRMCIIMFASSIPTFPLCVCEMVNKINCFMPDALKPSPMLVPLIGYNNYPIFLLGIWIKLIGMLILWTL